MPEEAPLLYAGGTSQIRAEGVQHSAERASSTHSSDIKLEVRRQLAEFMAMHEDESIRLRRQVEVLTQENRDLRSRTERASPKAPGSGMEGSGLPGLGWFGRGIGTILGSIPKTGSPNQAMDLRPSRAPVPPPPPPPEAYVREPQGTTSQGLDLALPVPPPIGPGIPYQRTMINEEGQTHQPVPRALDFGNAAAHPRASAQPPPGPVAGAQSTAGSVLDPLSVVLTGMAQLQGVISEMAATPKASSKNETIKPGTSALPDLPGVGPEACLEFSDWLHNSRPALADISDSSEELWENVVNEAGAWYSEYLRKPPLERLTMKPRPSEYISQAKWGRVSRRIEGMLITAAPQQVKDELSAARVSGILPVLCRLFIIYAPGGLSEREIGLRQVTEPTSASTPKDAVLHLRKWQRWCSRIKELGGTLPDSTLRVKALERIVKTPLMSYPDIGFRINLTRAALQIDSTPDDHKVDQLHAQLLSELELVSHRAAKDSDKIRETGAPVPPKVRGVEHQEAAGASPKTSKNSSNPPKVNPKAPGNRSSGSNEDQATKPRCTFYLGPNGCKKGSDCTYTHDWNAIPFSERSQRCKACGAKGHRASDCRAGTKVEEKAKARPQPRTSGTPKSSTEIPQPPPPPNRDAELKSILADAASILRQTIPVPTVEATQAEGSPSSRATGPTVGAGTGATPQANSVTPGTPVSMEMLSAQLEGIRAMARGFETKAEAKACRVDEVLSAGCAINRVLLDSGATHPVIPYNSSLQDLERVSVTLAGDGKQQWLRTQGGTLVVPPMPEGSSSAEPPQTIIPLGALVQSLGCTLTWSKRKGLRVTHPRLGLLRTGVGKNTCPYVQEKQALELIQELELKKLKDFEAQVEEFECELQCLSMPSDPTEALRKFIKTGSRGDALRAILCQPYLDEVPEGIKTRLAESIPPLDDHGCRRVLKRLPLPRAARRSLLGSSKWVVHLCSGQTTKGDMVKRWCHAQGCEVLHLDIVNKGGKGWDLTVPDGSWSALLWGAAAGRVVAVFSSPPSRSWSDDSAQRETGPEDRTREDPWCSQGTAERTVRENLMLVQDMFLWSVASVARSKGIPYLKEFPNPPEDSNTGRRTSG